jgi:uncharacterized membrane protein
MPKLARIAMACVMVLCATCVEAQSYDLQVLVQDGYAEAIGRSGDVALTVPYGNDCQSHEAAVYRSNQVDYLACNAEARGVNAGGDVVGDAGGGTLWKRSGEQIKILSPRGKHPTSPRAINDAGMVVGTYGKSHGIDHCLGWTQQEGSYDLGLPAGATTCVANAVNDRSWVSGYVYNPVSQNAFAFIWKDRHFHLLPILEGTQSCQALAINRHGEAVGICSDDRGYVHPVL